VKLSEQKYDLFNYSSIYLSIIIAIYIIIYIHWYIMNYWFILGRKDINMQTQNHQVMHGVLIENLIYVPTLIIDKNFDQCGITSQFIFSIKHIVLIQQTI
jgi:hypothetical protein